MATESKYGLGMLPTSPSDSRYERLAKKYSLPLNEIKKKVSRKALGKAMKLSQEDFVKYFREGRITSDTEVIK